MTEHHLLYGLKKIRFVFKAFCNQITNVVPFILYLDEYQVQKVALTTLIVVATLLSLDCISNRFCLVINK